MISLDKRHNKDKEVVAAFDGRVKDIRVQLADQVQCLDSRLEVNKNLLTELQDFYRRRAEVEVEYSRALDRLAKGILMRNKQEKQRRESWSLYSTNEMWQQLVQKTKRASHRHSVLADIYGNTMVARLLNLTEDMQRIYRKVREINVENQDELLKVLSELQSALKTYHFYHGESLAAENKLQEVELQKDRLLEASTSKTFSLSKKLKHVDKQLSKRQVRYTEQKMKSLQARNDYLLALDAANAAINRYFCEDLHNLINCIDCGYHSALKKVFQTDVSARQCIINAERHSVEDLQTCIQGLDQRADKQRFLENNNQAFSLPKKFDFHPHKGDQVSQVSAQKGVQDDLMQRRYAIEERINALKLDLDETWKTVETVEKSFLDLINEQETDVSIAFSEEQKVPRSPHERMKKRSDRLDTEEYYIQKVKEFTLQSNLIARLQIKLVSIQKALGAGSDEPKKSDIRRNRPGRPPSLPPKPRHSRRLGKMPIEGRPKLFGGSIEEYTEASGEDVPLIVRSCIRVINLFGRHHMGVFRVSGSQHEINEFKAAFERGEDPLTEVVAARDINSVAGVLKLYFRELKEPLFPTHLFDELVNASKLPNPEFISRVRELLLSVPRSIYIVMRYLFAFLSHLSESCDENMMDAHNLGVCFGPTLLPLPPERDQDVFFHNQVIEVVKNIISNNEEIFTLDLEGTLYERFEFIDDEDGDTPDSIDNLSDEDLEEVGESEEDIFSEPETPSSAGSQHATNFEFKTTTVPKPVVEEAENTGKLANTSLEGHAQYDFHGRTERELTFTKGDSISALEKISNDWWKGTLKGRRGLVPDKYITVKRPTILPVGKEEKRKSAEGALPVRPADLGVPSDISASQPSMLPGKSLPSPVQPLSCTSSTSSDTIAIRSTSSSSSLLSASDKAPSVSSFGKKTISPSSEQQVRGPSPSPEAAANSSSEHELSASNSLEQEIPVNNLPAPDVAADTSAAVEAEAAPEQTVLTVNNVTLDESTDKPCAVPGQDWGTELDNTLAEIISGVESLKVPPEELAATTISHAPDLVKGLPVSSRQTPPPQPPTRDDNAKPLSTAEVFASSGHSTIKKGSHSFHRSGQRTAHVEASSREAGAQPASQEQASNKEEIRKVFAEMKPVIDGSGDEATRASPNRTASPYQPVQRPSPARSDSPHEAVRVSPARSASPHETDRPSPARSDSPHEAPRASPSRASPALSDLPRETSHVSTGKTDAARPEKVKPPVMKKPAIMKKPQITDTSGNKS